MPVVAAVERGRQFSRRSHIRIAVQVVTEFVRILLMDARECKIGEPLSGINAKTRGHSGCLGSAQNAHNEKQDSGA